MLFNFPFPWRRYPVAWARKQHRPAPPVAGEQPVEIFSRHDLITAAGAMYPPVNINSDTMETMCNPALRNSANASLRPADIRPGGNYCNGAFGPDWQVRQVIDSAGTGTPGSGKSGMVTYRVVAGNRRRRTGVTEREAFAGWARYEVFLNENSWQRVAATPGRAVTGDAA